MVGFGPKQAWLAVRDGAPDEVAAALALRDLGPVSWRSGIDLAYLTDDRVVITPHLSGPAGGRWLLVAGRWLLRRSTAGDARGAGPRGIADPVDLSARLDTEVQLFATYRVGERHAWQRAVGGSLVRAFSYDGVTGEVTVWQGDPDEAELTIGLPRRLDDETDVLVSEYDVLRLACAWSIDPSTLDDQPAPGPLRAAAAA
jgi:hypothetical protein